jgi:hypothetical protein
MDKCPDIAEALNTENKCSLENLVPEDVDGPLYKLPGVNEIYQWS